MNVFLERLHSTNIFTNLNLHRVYNLVCVQAGNEWKMMFCTHYRVFEYLAIPFWLCSAPTTFQDFINNTCRDMLDQFVVIYLDDILIFFENQTLPDQHALHVLERLHQNYLCCKLEKG
ncbi:unnamed protein product [Natator depressus]